jgi:hypothetical protein
MVAFLEALLDENTWVRVGMVIAGAILILFALRQSDPLSRMVNALRAGF